MANTNIAADLARHLLLLCVENVGVTEQTLRAILFLKNAARYEQLMVADRADEGGVSGWDCLEDDDLPLLARCCHIQNLDRVGPGRVAVASKDVKIALEEGASGVLPLYLQARQVSHSLSL